MFKKITFLSLIGILIVGTVAAIYVFRVLNAQQRCDLFHGHSAYTMETWGNIQFNLPICWKATETADGFLSLSPSSAYPIGHSEEFPSVLIVPSADVADKDLLDTLELHDMTYDIYRAEGSFSSFYVPRDFEYPMSLMLWGTSYENSPYYPIIFGSLRNNPDYVAPVSESEAEPATDTPSTSTPVAIPIQITSPDDRSVFDPSVLPIEFTGTVAANVQKIVVYADYSYTDIEAGTVTSMRDEYQLTSFHQGDTTFVYRASTDWNNLGLGENHYTFTAYFEDGTTSSVERDLCFQFEIFYPPSCWQD